VVNLQPFKIIIMKKNIQFNQTHVKYLDGEGLLLDVPQVVHYLNEIFNDLTKIKGFKYKEISTIRGLPRVDTNLTELMPFVGRIIHEKIEESLSIILKVEFEVEQRLSSLNIDKQGNSIIHE
jgi:hypothetical protein